MEASIFVHLEKLGFRGYFSLLIVALQIQSFYYVSYFSELTQLQNQSKLPSAVGVLSY